MAVPTPGTVRPKSKSKLHSRIALFSLQGLVFYTTLLLLYADTFSGVIRYGAIGLHVAFLSYIPMVLVSVVVLAVVVIAATRSDYDLRILGVGAFFFVFALYSLAMGRSILAIGFSMYAWGPLFLGLLVLRFNLFSRLLPHTYWLLTVAIVGVLVNSFVSFPWIGADTVNIGGAEVAAAKSWSAFGVERLPGFSRQNTVAGDDIALFLSWMLCTKRSFLIKLLLWGTGLYAVVLTTSKTPMAVIVAVPVILAIYHTLSRSAANRGNSTAYSYLLLASLLLVVIGLPLSSNFTQYGNARLPLSDVLPFMRIDSFVDRVQGMWPQAFALLRVGNSTVQWIFGRGIGGIGIGQKFDEPSLANSADNLHVFLYVTFGVFCCAFYGVLIAGHKKAMSGKRLPSSIYLVTLFAVLGFGTLTSVVEGPIPVFAIGLLISACIAPNPVTPRNPAHQLETISAGNQRLSYGPDRIPDPRYASPVGSRR